MRTNTERQTKFRVTLKRQGFKRKFVYVHESDVDKFNGLCEQLKQPNLPSKAR